MSAIPLSEPWADSVGDAAQALYFGPVEQQLFGWLHRPEPHKTTDLGLILCNPFGYEAICSHRSVRAFAEAAAAMGVSSLRFDYRGTGDSAEIDPSADQIALWTNDVLAAISELRAQTGVERVCLLGFRVGALLAALAARERNEVLGLMAIAPVVSGRRYVKELRTTRLAALLGSETPQAPKSPADGRLAAGPVPLEVSGYLLSAATLGSLSKVDLTAFDNVSASRLLVIDAENMPVARDWTDSLRRTGVDIEYHALPGTVEMLMTAPQFAVVPRNMIAAMQKWLAECMPAPSPRAADISSRRAAVYTDGAASEMALPAVDGLRSAPLLERAVRFGNDAALFGIITLPPQPTSDQSRRPAIILLNPGVDHHIGASRLYVSFARQWGGKGHVVLRMDLAGIGDSATLPGNEDDDVFPPSALDDIRSAIGYLRDRYQVGDVSLVGLCSGAYHALRAAAAGVQVRRILMINAQNYFWNDDMSIDDLQLVEVVRNPGVYRHQILSMAAWKRLVGGEVNVFRIVQVYVQRLRMAVTFCLRDIARRLHIRLTNDLARDLEEIASRGISMAFVFARGEPGLDLLELESGTAISRLGSHCRVHVLETGDHVFSHHDSRVELENVLNDELSRDAH